MIKDENALPEIKTAQPGHLIVAGNEKGGAGKSTIALHLTMALLHMGKSVGVLDLDLRQRTLGRYLENRRLWIKNNGTVLPMPVEGDFGCSSDEIFHISQENLTTLWYKTITTLRAMCDFVILDAPGAMTPLSLLAHHEADTLITPINDSFVDFDLLAHVDPHTFAVGKPSFYSEMVWESRKKKAIREKRGLDWVVMRNRLSSISSRNKNRLHDALKALAARVGFRVAPGFSERVIYKEMFPHGLTLLDLGQDQETSMTLSHIAAKQELRDLLIVLKLPGLKGLRFSF